MKTILTWTVLIGFLAATLFLISACTYFVPHECSTNMFDSNGNCCESLCNLECPNGYLPGTCNCECITEENLGDTGIDTVFDEGGDITPPGIPG